MILGAKHVVYHSCDHGLGCWLIHTSYISVRQLGSAHIIKMTPHGNTFRAIDPLWQKSTCHRLQRNGALIFSLLFDLTRPEEAVGQSYTPWCLCDVMVIRCILISPAALARCIARLGKQDYYHSVCEVSWIRTLWLRSRRCGCHVTWFCYHLIAKPGNKTATPSWSVPFTNCCCFECAFKLGSVPYKPKRYI